MIYKAATGKAFKQEAVSELGWIRRDFNISDSLTKIEANDIMKKFILTCTLEYMIEQFVITNHELLNHVF